jgi:formylglycine-generating enzyme required for sulfatase activity
MGSDDHYPEEAPAHRVRVEPFAIDATQVTNEQYGAFVAATGYRTVAERPLRAEDLREFRYASRAGTFEESEPITEVGARSRWTVVSMAADWSTVFPPTATPT